MGWTAYKLPIELAATPSCTSRIRAVVDAKTSCPRTAKKTSMRALRILTILPPPARPNNSLRPSKIGPPRQSRIGTSAYSQPDAQQPRILDTERRAAPSRPPNGPDRDRSNQTDCTCSHHACKLCNTIHHRRDLEGLHRIQRGDRRAWSGDQGHEPIGHESARHAEEAGTASTRIDTGSEPVDIERSNAPLAIPPITGRDRVGTVFDP